MAGLQSIHSGEEILTVEFDEPSDKDRTSQCLSGTDTDGICVNGLGEVRSIDRNSDSDSVRKNKYYRLSEMYRSDRFLDSLYFVYVPLIYSPLEMLLIVYCIVQTVQYTLYTT